MTFWKFGLAACLLVLAGCNPFPQTWEWNQKLTVEIITPEGLRSGSATTKVRWQEENSVGNYPGSYRGEAAAVDLGDGRYLFALLSEETRYLALRIFSKDLGENAMIDEKGFAAMAALRGKREVPREYYPLLVTFDDIADPATVKRVDPDDLAASFGPGVALKRITLTITDEPVTEGEVEKVLGWLDGLNGSYLHGESTSRGSPLGLHTGNFVKPE
jgi:hypothetical protein